VQLSQQALQPPGDAYAGWAILAELAGWLGLRWNYAGPEAIFAEIASLNPYYGGLSYPRLQNQGLQWPCSVSDHPGTRYLHEGRCIRGLGLFTAVDNELSAHPGDQAIFTCRDRLYPDFKCRDSIRERHSLISKLRK
jgi:predicted molibdopterin-dependent oxidoreductase YjgC